MHPFDEKIIEGVHFECKESTESAQYENNVIDKVDNSKSSQHSFDNEEIRNDNQIRTTVSCINEKKSHYQDIKPEILGEVLEKLEESTAESFNVQEEFQKHINRGKLGLPICESEIVNKFFTYETETSEDDIKTERNEFEVSNRNYNKINEFFAQEQRLETPVGNELGRYESDASEDVYVKNQLFVEQPDEQVRFPSPTSVSEYDDVMTIKTESRDYDDFVVAVKFRFDNNEMITSTFKIHTKVYEVKERLASIFKIKSDNILLKHDGIECDDILPLSGLGAEPLGTIELGIQSTDPKKCLTPVQFHCYIPVVDVITVRIPLGEGRFKDVVVEIENQNFIKEWLGGYRHRLTKIEYHHAGVQTMPRFRSSNLPSLYSRDTQTPGFPFQDITIETSVSKSTQMWHNDHFIPEISDKVIVGNSHRFKSKKEHMTFSNLVIWVVWMKRLMKKFIEKNKQRELKLYDEIRLRNEEASEKMFLKTNKREILSENFPVKQSDFYMLYLMIGKWWKNEVEHIKKTKHDEAKKAAFIRLLEKEVELLSVIDRQRIQAKKDSMKKQEIRFLESTARPIIFCTNKGTISSIDTVETQKAREYKQILSSFMRTDVTKEERIDILNNIKCLIKDYGFNEHTNEIVSLINRECKLLSLGIKDKQLQGLRERIEHLIIYYLHEYVVNSSTKRYKKPNDLKTDQNFYQCQYCKKLKPISDYNVHVKMTSFNMCRNCEWTKNIGIHRIDLSPYARLLDHVRQTEMDNYCYSSIFFILQVTGMYYLTRNIWNNQSVISENDNLDILRMVRFKKDEDWSPWNCILLTLEESLAHLSISDVESVYNTWLLKKIKWKHMRAKNHFLPLLLNDKLICQSRLWFEATSSGKFLPSSNVTNFALPKDFYHIS